MAFVGYVAALLVFFGTWLIPRFVADRWADRGGDYNRGMDIGLGAMVAADAALLWIVWRFAPWLGS